MPGRCCAVARMCYDRPMTGRAIVFLTMLLAASATAAAGPDLAALVGDATAKRVAVDLRTQASDGALAVAFLSGPGLDAVGDIDPATVVILDPRRLGEGAPSCTARDVDGDGAADLLCHFALAGLGFEGGEVAVGAALIEPRELGCLGHQDTVYGIGVVTLASD